ncbi:MAG: hypothetical protein J2P23_05800, partial [Microlunatus sp.]|nr:hypothetical protein [Microlunatus sp.]
MSTYLSAAELQRALALRDLTDPAAGTHAMQRLLDQIVDALTTRWQVPASVVRVPPLVAVGDNYDQLGYD